MIPSRILPFQAFGGSRRAVGTVHQDGSITYAGVRYPSIQEVPAECAAFRVDVETYVQWKRLYRAVVPRRRA